MARGESRLLDDELDSENIEYYYYYYYYYHYYFYFIIYYYYFILLLLLKNFWREAGASPACDANNIVIIINNIIIIIINNWPRLLDDELAHGLDVVDVVEPVNGHPDPLQRGGVNLLIIYW